mmetsp:Transcript_74141/g.206076  ORF Transcript_74141/g.206076 Transcript_74141/m.206076 type:complete len:881 (+) Transcript_74141:79-2721(+)
MPEPAQKKQKTGANGDAPATPAAAKSESKKEQEQDARVDGRPKLKEPIVFHPEETTLNVLPSVHGAMLTPLSDGGMQYLLAGARACVGVGAGRYMFEVQIVDFLNPQEESQARSRALGPRHLLHVGLSLGGSSLFLGDGESNVCFDTEGNFTHGKKSVSALGGVKLGRGDILAVVLNLVAGSPNANSVSLFRNGQRVSEPQPLPEELKGKDLYPAVTFRNVTLHYNFGPSPMAPLPFKCRMWQDAAQKDVQVTQPAHPPKDGKYEVLFPVCLPDEGTFDWLDLFLERNPQYAEISDRALVSWVEKSGIARQKTNIEPSKVSNDKPDMTFGIPSLDDLSHRRLLQLVAPMHSRSFIMMEVKANLVREERKELVTKWCPASFRRVAVVLLGEPSAAFKKRSQELILKQKQDAAESEHKEKLDRAHRNKVLARRQKELERVKRQAERQRKKAEAERIRKIEIEKLQREAAERGEPFIEPLVEELKELESEEEKEEEQEVVEEPPPSVSLTAEEQKQLFRKNPVPDISAYVLSTSFTKFAMPERDEGFDEIRYDWQKLDGCRDCIRRWVQERKMTTRIEDLTPSDWFATRWKEWQKGLQSWHSRQTQHKALLEKKAELAAAKKNGVESAPDEAAMREEEADQPKAEFDKLDIFGVEDVLDVGGGRPLFSEFAFEDWTMMSLRFELHLLVHAFRRDVNDPDRIGIHADHLTFYYNKYYKKQLSPKFFGVDSIRELMELVRDSVVVARNNVAEAQLPDDLDSAGIFVMLTEEARRDRIRRIDLGDETARLKLMQPSMPNAPGAPSQQGGQMAPGAGHRPVMPGSGAGPMGGARPGAMPPVNAVVQQPWRPGQTPTPWPAYGTGGPGGAASFRPYSPAWRAAWAARG